MAAVVNEVEEARRGSQFQIKQYKNTQGSSNLTVVRCAMRDASRETPKDSRHHGRAQAPLARWTPPARRNQPSALLFGLVVRQAGGPEGPVLRVPREILAARGAGGAGRATREAHLLVVLVGLRHCSDATVESSAAAPERRPGGEKVSPGRRTQRASCRRRAENEVDEDERPTHA